MKRISAANSANPLSPFSMDQDTAIRPTVLPELGAQLEYERLGAVSFHNAKLRADCNLAKSDPLRRYWLAGWDGASLGESRVDGLNARAKGAAACRISNNMIECPYLHGTNEHADWFAGWAQAELINRPVVWR